MTRHRYTAVACLLALLVATGCSGAGSQGSDGGTGLRSREMTTGLAAPSLTREGTDSATAIGTVVYRRDQGGFFALADIVPGDEPDASAGIVVILVQSDGGREASDLGSMVGAYCAVSGTLRDEVATSTPAPELIVESYRILQMP